MKYHYYYNIIKDIILRNFIIYNYHLCCIYTDKTESENIQSFACLSAEYILYKIESY